MNQGGLKHAATESRLDTKRERRRGASGRAAALRRAPSDSDCSGETASLSADSGERRPPPPPPRLNKRGSRRRGSEWEVLEGLKDGQRFEKRPDVFNGYLHKKRKWPLKGWHKRFFVVDGGILVYARSPTDVARGRLHGSVDVGLSVISAKPRRRRVDIDADEFIYHLRAKTNEVFRTWLSVLKAHRLYRQHLLTFGARESVPKIHAPNDDLPPTDNSSRASVISTKSSIITSHEDVYDQSTITSSSKNTNNSELNSYDNTKAFRVNNEKKKIYFKFQKKTIDIERLNDILKKRNRSICSMNCCARINGNDINIKPKDKASMASTNAEKQVLITDLETISNPVTSPNKSMKYMMKSHKKGDVKVNLCPENRTEPTFYFFSRKKKFLVSQFQSPMKKSRKSTNLVKYRNISVEPSLKAPYSNCLLLKLYKQSRHGHKDRALKKLKQNSIPKTQTSAQTSFYKKVQPKSLQDFVSTSEYERITERIMTSMFETLIINNGVETEIKSYVNQVVRELFDVKISQTGIHPVKLLFRSLLEYWLKNTNDGILKQPIRRVKSVEKPSISHFTKDKTLSSLAISKANKQTQFHGISDLISAKVPCRLSTGTYTRSPDTSKGVIDKKFEITPNQTPDTNSFERERRVQELETILKNTIYVCETVRSIASREKDITITRKLIQNLDKIAKKTEKSGNQQEISNTSSELPKIEETINHLISDASISPGLAKDLLNAYLGILLDSSKSFPSIQSSEDSTERDEIISCDVATESVQRKVSKSVLTSNSNSKVKVICHTNGDHISQHRYSEKDSGKLYLKDVFDKITSIFTKSDKNETECHKKERKIEKVKKKRKQRRGLRNRKIDPDKLSDDAVVVDLSKYDLEHISMYSEPALQGMSITIKLKGKQPNYGDMKKQQFSLKFYDDYIRSSDLSDDDWLNNFDATSFRRIFEPYDMNVKTTFDFGTVPVEIPELKPYGSVSDATSKDQCRILEESDPSIDLSFQSSNYFRKDISDDNEETQSCFIMSSIKTGKPTMPSKTQYKHVSLRPSFNEVTSSGIKESTSSLYPEEYSLFGQPAPKIIDEKFILLLLENVTLLSKNLPSIYKDLNALFLKLRKKHEKLFRNITNVPGLSLLGRIYNDDKLTNRETQFDHIDSLTAANKETKVSKELKDVAVVTSKTMYKNVDKCVSPCFVTLNLCKEVQTANNYDMNKNKKLTDNMQLTDDTSRQICFCKDFAIFTKIDDKQLSKKSPDISDNKENDKITAKDKENIIHNNLPSSSSKLNLNRTIFSSQENETSTTTWNENDSTECDKVNSVLNSNADVESTADIIGNCLDSLEHGTSIQKWYESEPKKDCATDTVIRTVIDNKKPENTKTVDEIRILKIHDDFANNKKSTVANNSFCKSISMRSPLFIAARHNPDFLFNKKKDLEKKRNNDINIYRVVLRKMELQKSSSMIDTSVISSQSDDLKTLFQCSSAPSSSTGLVSPTSPPLRGPQAGFVSGTPGGRLASWIIESGGPLENASRELGQAQLSVQQLQRLLETLELQQQVHHDTDVSLEGASPNVKKDRRKFGLRKKKSNSKCASVELAPPHIDPSNSHMALSALTAPPSPGGGASSMPNSAASLPIACAAARPQSLPGAETLAGAGGPASISSLTPDHQLREDFTVLAKDLVASLKGIVSTLVIERGRLRSAVEATENSSPGALLSALRTNLSSALHQNNELRSRLSRIHDASDLAEISSVGPNSEQQGNRQFQQSLSYSSSCVSASEFFDAEEHDDDRKPTAGDIIPGDEAGVIELDGDSSSEAGSLSSEEGSASSENSDAEQVTLRVNQNGVEAESTGWARRTTLPRPRPTPGGPSLWNLLYKNIGKDLSQVSMPVTINEPLNMLQRLCEELEYSELLDAAAECGSGVERAALVAAFAVSAYAAAAQRAASKPFNPMLAETYECVRTDRGFRFIAEQVSHHPPISACHAESERWTFWQEARIKTKFWGKSMEFQPAGRVHVRLHTTGDHYTWNKVTTCVHNLFGGQRWVDQYGDMHIVCNGTDISCKLNFIKASSWSSSRHEVRGFVTSGSSRLRLQGRWSEALYGGDPPAARCLWRPGAMPAEHSLYYGFTRFAMELNELEPGMREILPHTDTRLRPDQRALEEGDVETAEQLKYDLEQEQRERRRLFPDHVPQWFRKIVEDGEETWVFTNEYWRARDAGFPNLRAPRLW